MGYLERYTNYLDELKAGLGTNILPAITNFKKNHIESFDYKNHNTGLIIGQVQSGKTLQMLGIIAAAADFEFKFFIILTTDNVRLQQQTLNRAKEYLDGIVVCGESDDVLFKSLDFRKPVLIVLKKNHSVLSTWGQNFLSNESSGYQPLLLLDDEGDAASLNTKVNLDDVSTINQQIGNIRQISPSSLYLQVTATPYAILLLTASSGIKPEFVYTFEPGNGYLGGSYFYSDDLKCVNLLSENERDILLRNDDTIPEGLQRAILYFLFVCCHFKKEGIPTCNFLVHPNFRIDDHNITSNKITLFLKEVAEALNDENSILKSKAEEDFGEFTIEGDFEDYWNSMSEILPLNTYIINSENAGEDYLTGYNIIIGGNSLGRGVTFPYLQVTYYCRRARAPQADTVWQHSRLFGYERIKEFCRVFLPLSLFRLFNEITKTNDALFNVLSRAGLEGISVLTPRGVRPTRPNVLDLGAITSLAGGVNYFLYDANGDNTELLDNRLGVEDGDNKVTLDEIMDILGSVSTLETERLIEFKKCVEILKSNENDEGRLFVRTDRNITKGTGTLLSPTDRTLSESFPEETVLFMYRLNGDEEQGWRGSPIWIPNIRYPDGLAFFTVED
ncbi:restriction endonuclease [Candidatus Marinimicrobia bacterium MT.SAG.3]|nr:restriction endonuclease [Candidatus Marinimicrobia bacterium MT.SAG.3]